MFTGITEEIGTIRALERRGDAATVDVACRTVVTDVHVGDSIAVAGCCLTVTTADGDGFRADLIAETLRATVLGDLVAGDRVNLERAVRADARLGGHLVQGHVDAVGEVVAVDDVPGTRFVTFSAPAEVAPYLVPKGSITVDGVSLTVVDTAEAPGGATFRVGLIPHTREVTTLGTLAVGDHVDLEADVVAKHVHHLLAGGVRSPYLSSTGPSAEEPV